MDARCRLTASRQHTDVRSGDPSAIGFRVARWRLLVGLTGISEVVKPPRITPVPGARNWFLGIANLRGTVLAVSDLAAFLGEQPTPQSKYARLLVLDRGEWASGILVDEVLGLFHTDEAQRVTEGVDAVSALQPYLSGFFHLQGQVWSEFDPGRLVADPRFLSAAS